MNHLSHWVVHYQILQERLKTMNILDKKRYIDSKVYAPALRNNSEDTELIYGLLEYCRTNGIRLFGEDCARIEIRRSGNDTPIAYAAFI